jgi:inner membrane protein
LLGRTHLLTACVLGVLVIKVFSIKSPLIFFIALLFGSLFPDIDSQTSILGRKIKFFSFFFKHRGFFHSSLILILICLIVFSLSKWFVIGFALGFLSHLILDAITKEGLTFLFIGKIKGPFKVGGWQEHIFALGMIIILFLSLIV